VLYHLLLPLREEFPVFNVVRYITFRTFAAVLTALVLAWIFGPAFIRLLRRLSVGQNIREVGPAAHLAKAGTPTMGGLLILFTLTGATLLWGSLENRLIWVVLLTTLAFGAIGFVDDWLKLRRRRNLGLTARGKLFLQIIAAAATASWMLYGPARIPSEPTLAFPFFKDLILDLGIWYLPFVVFVVVGASNAVNLTDGLDGLAIGCTLIAAATYAIFTYVAGNRIVASYLQVPYVPGAGEVAVFCGALVGASVGFLWFNAHPAEVFMGDVGSLALGAAIGTVAVVSKQEMLLAIVGGVFVLEALSVMVQVASFRLRGKRVLRMAPFHHHLELSGWAEPKVIVRIWILAGLCALIGLSTLKLR
jgi:phospho-N-acetylmuramoyl-pentapeptide-transferase